MIKVIAFDYNGVISAFGPIKKWMDTNISKDEEKYLIYKKSAPKWDRGEIELREMYEILSTITGVKAEKIWSEYFEKQILNEGMIELVNKLKLNYKIFLFSNHQGELLQKLLKKHGIKNLFDEIIVSSDHMLIKPNPIFFEVLVKTAGVNKDEILFIDDSIENVEGGINFGIKSILYKNTKNLEDDLEKMGLSF